MRLITDEYCLGPSLPLLVNTNLFQDVSSEFVEGQVREKEEKTEASNNNAKVCQYFDAKFFHWKYCSIFELKEEEKMALIKFPRNHRAILPLEVDIRLLR